MRNPARLIRSRLFQFIFATLISLSLLFPVLVQAASPISDSQFYQSVESDVPNNFNTFSQTAFFGISTTILCYLSGIDITNPERGCLDYNPVTKKLGYGPPPDPNQPGGLLGLSTVMISMMYTQPASSGQYVSHLANNFGFVDHANAQPMLEAGDSGGIQDTRQGFEGLSSILQLFIKIRDMTYILLVIIFIVVGIGIMLRLNIDPRTVMTIQNQIPKLIIGIILITFSYAIAGLMFDATWVVTYFGINTITATPACEDQGDLAEIATKSLYNPPFWYASDVFSKCQGKFDGMSGLAWEVGKTLGQIISTVNLGRLGLAEDKADDCDPGVSLLGFNIGGDDGADIQDCVAEGVFFIIKWFVAIVFFIVLLVSIFIALFRVWYMLLRAYISIIIAIILAPFWILLGLLPGGGLGFGQWMRHMIAHLAIFPAAALMYTLASYIASNSLANAPGEGDDYLLPLIGNPSIGDNIGYLTALGFILLTPDLLNLIRDALKTPSGKYTGNIFTNARAGSPGKAMGGIGQLGALSLNLTSINGLRRSIGGRFGGGGGGGGGGHGP